MSEHKKCFTFIWKIKNFSFIFSGKDITSPSFFVQGMDETKWELYLRSHSVEYKGCIACYLRRRNDDRGPYQYELDFELSFLASDGSVLHSETFLKTIFRKLTFGNSALQVKRDELSLKKDLFIPDDTLTIRCRMWNNKESISESESCFAETRIETECRSVVGTIEKFSCVETGLKYPILESSPTEFFISSMNLSFADNCLLNFEIESMNNHIFKLSKIFILDEHENKVISGQGEFYSGNSFCIPLNISKDYLMKNKKCFLPNDKLAIHCEIIEDAGKLAHAIQYIFNSEDTQPIASNIRSTDKSSEESHVENLTTLKDDWISLFNEGILCDTKLKTATETFPAHTVVLSARSSVFKSMFTTGMKEKTNNCVDIDDLDADTVCRMLLFMYSDTLDDLKNESAKSLYFAADKYNIVSLRSRCSNILKQNLLQSNCCDFLLLADTHQDTALKNAVQDYIALNHESVLTSNDWKNLEKKHPHLTIEVFRFIYIKNLPKLRA